MAVTVAEMIARRACLCSIAILLSSAVLPTSTVAEPPDEPVTPIKAIQLFNGRDLAGFYTWQKETQLADPTGVYSVKDGVLRISGEGIGYLATKVSYRDYRLIVEYCWGKRTDGTGIVRNSGILLHAVGPDGNFEGQWMSSIECQLAQGCEGDLIVIRGKDDRDQTTPVTISSDVRIGEDGNSRWATGGKKMTYSGKQFWWSNHDPAFKELLDTRGRWDVASPLGEWTRVECICAGDRIAIHINGKLVNEAYNVFPSAGKILLENEGNEILFRRIELLPLKREEKQ